MLELIIIGAATVPLLYLSSKSFGYITNQMTDEEKMQLIAAKRHISIQRIDYDNLPCYGAVNLDLLIQNNVVGTDLNMSSEELEKRVGEIHKIYGIL